MTKIGFHKFLTITYEQGQRVLQSEEYHANLILMRPIKNPDILFLVTLKDKFHIYSFLKILTDSDFYTISEAIGSTSGKSQDNFPKFRFLTGH